MAIKLALAQFRTFTASMAANTNVSGISLCEIKVDDFTEVVNQIKADRTANQAEATKYINRLKNKLAQKCMKAVNQRKLDPEGVLLWELVELAAIYFLMNDDDSQAKLLDPQHPTKIITLLVDHVNGVTDFGAMLYAN